MIAMTGNDVRDAIAYWLAAQHIKPLEASTSFVVKLHPRLAGLLAALDAGGSPAVEVKKR